MHPRSTYGRIAAALAALVWTLTACGSDAPDPAPEAFNVAVRLASEDLAVVTSWTVNLVDPPVRVDVEVAGELFVELHASDPSAGTSIWLNRSTVPVNDISCLLSGSSPIDADSSEVESVAELSARSDVDRSDVARPDVDRSDVDRPSFLFFTSCFVGRFIDPRTTKTTTSNANALPPITAGKNQGGFFCFANGAAGF